MCKWNVLCQKVIFGVSHTFFMGPVGCGISHPQLSEKQAVEMIWLYKPIARLGSIYN